MPAPLKLLLLVVGLIPVVGIVVGLLWLAYEAGRRDEREAYLQRRIAELEARIPS